MANNILEQISILGLAVEIQTLREENERLRDQVRDFQAQDFVQHVLSTDKLYRALFRYVICYFQFFGAWV